MAREREHALERRPLARSMPSPSCFPHAAQGVTQPLPVHPAHANPIHPHPLPTAAQVLGAPLPYNSIDDVRRRLADVAPHFGRRDAVEAPLWLNGEYFKVRMGAWGGRWGGWVGARADAVIGCGWRLWYITMPAVGSLLAPLLTHAPTTPAHPSCPQAFAERAKAAKAGAEPLATSIAQFYQTDAISRASKVMAKCIKVRAAWVAGQRGSWAVQAQQAQQGRGGRTDACERRAGAAPTGWRQCLALGRSATQPASGSNTSARCTAQLGFAAPTDPCRPAYVARRRGKTPSPACTRRPPATERPAPGLPLELLLAA